MLRTNDEQTFILADAPLLTDLNTGEKVEVISPSRFTLETILVSSAYYRVEGREYRFLLPEARIAGLKIQKD